MVGKQIQTCFNCRRQKRRCTRELPQCRLCRQSGIACEYPKVSNGALAKQIPANAFVSTFTDLFPEQHLDTSSDELTHTSCSSRIPALFFLDHDIYVESGTSVQLTSNGVVTLPERLISKNQQHNTTSFYFEGVNQWFPIICRKRFEIMLDAELSTLGSDTNLLLVSMDLINTIPTQEARTAAYWSVKALAVRLESTSTFTVRFLQANVLIALYELSHAVYPAAYLSVSKCISIAKIMGIDNRKDAPQMLRTHGSWAQKEETRRLWWAILLLDRYVHIGFSGHALGTEEPLAHEILPASDACFEAAEFSVNEPLFLVGSHVSHAGPFTRSCQAIHLLGKVIHVVNDFQRNTEGRFEQGLSLHHTLASFAQVIEADFEAQPVRYATPLALVYSAQIALYEPYSCTERNRGTHTPKEVELQGISITGIKSVADRVYLFVGVLQSDSERTPNSLSSLLGYCLYMACATAAWRVYEGERASQIKVYHFLRAELQNLGSRWNVGKEYLVAVDKANQTLYADAPP